jgi:hypothetical protein
LEYKVYNDIIRSPIFQVKFLIIMCLSLVLKFLEVYMQFLIIHLNS